MCEPADLLALLRALLQLTPAPAPTFETPTLLLPPRSW